MSDYVSEQAIFRVLNGIKLHATIARTLAHCIFWSQHAQHHQDDAPRIWKTGPSIGAELRIAPRTANRHLKELAALGYWTLSYRPRPGTIGKVTWLTFTPRAAALLGSAREHDAAAATKRKAQKGTPEGDALDHSTVAAWHIQSSHGVTSSQKTKTEETPKNGKSFLLFGQAAKTAMKKQATLKQSEENWETLPSPPSYVKASKAEREFAGDIRTAWVERGLTEWDWGSKHTWQHIAIIAHRSEKAGVLGAETKPFLRAMLGTWCLLRSSMIPRYRDHASNLHAPSPMALALQWDVICSRVIDILKPAAPAYVSASLDEGL